MIFHVLYYVLYYANVDIPTFALSNQDFAHENIHIQARGQVTHETGCVYVD